MSHGQPRFPKSPQRFSDTEAIRLRNESESIARNYKKKFGEIVASGRVTMAVKPIITWSHRLSKLIWGSISPSSATGVLNIDRGELLDRLETFAPNFVDSYRAQYVKKWELLTVKKGFRTDISLQDERNSSQITELVIKNIFFTTVSLLRDTWKQFCSTYRSNRKEIEQFEFYQEKIKNKSLNEFDVFFRGLLPEFFEIPQSEALDLEPYIPPKPATQLTTPKNDSSKANAKILEPKLDGNQRKTIIKEIETGSVATKTDDEVVITLQPKPSPHNLDTNNTDRRATRVFVREGNYLQQSPSKLFWTRLSLQNPTKILQTHSMDWAPTDRTVFAPEIDSNADTGSLLRFLNKAYQVAKLDGGCSFLQYPTDDAESEEQPKLLVIMSSKDLGVNQIGQTPVGTACHHLIMVFSMDRLRVGSLLSAYPLPQTSAYLSPMIQQVFSLQS